MEPRAIVGFDASDGAEDALAFANVLRRALDYQLVVAACAVDPLYHLGGRYPQYLRTVAEDALSTARTSLEDHRGVAFRVAPGSSAGAALHGLAQDLDASVVVVGATHHHAATQPFLPSVTHQTIQGAPCAVAVAPAGYRNRPHLALHRLAVAFDGSEESRAALSYATTLAARIGATIEVLHSFKPGASAAAFAAVSYAVPDFLEEAKSLARDHLEDGVAAARRAAPGVDVTGALLTGNPAEELVKMSDDVDLLFLGSRGYGPARRAMLGSVSGAVVRSAKCPVFVLPRGAQVASADASVATATASVS